MKFWKIWRGWLALNVSVEATYRFNFFMKILAMIVFDSFGPLLALVIYGVSSGIPGWSFEEFLLMQGLFSLTTGLVHFMFWGFAGRIVEAVRDGRYDVELVRPGNPLLLAMATGSNMDGAPRTCVGIVVTTYALTKLGWIFSITNLFYFAALVVSAILFFLALQVIIAAMSFLFVKSYTLMQVFDVFTDIGKNPITVFGPIGVTVMTYLFPIGLAAFYPAQAILGRMSPISVLAVFGMGVLFFAASAGLWNIGLKRYTSAGG